MLLKDKIQELTFDDVSEFTNQSPHWDTTRRRLSYPLG